MADPGSAGGGGAANQAGSSGVLLKGSAVTNHKVGKACPSCGGSSDTDPLGWLKSALNKLGSGLNKLGSGLQKFGSVAVEVYTQPSKFFPRIPRDSISNAINHPFMQKVVSPTLQGYGTLEKGYVDTARDVVTNPVGLAKNTIKGAVDIVQNPPDLTKPLSPAKAQQIGALFSARARGGPLMGALEESAGSRGARLDGSLKESGGTGEGNTGGGTPGKGDPGNVGGVSRPSNPWVRQDNNPYGGTHPTRGTPKAHIDSDGNLRPPNPEGKGSIRNHINGGNPGQSPFTSFKEQGGVGKNYGKYTITLDVNRLSNDISAGKVKGVEVVPHQEVKTALKNDVINASDRYKQNPTAKNLDRLKSASQDLRNARRDSEALIKGIIPKGYFSVEPNAN